MAWQSRPNDRAARARRQAVIDRAGGRCQIRGPECTGVATRDDHIVPLAEGGTDRPSNHQAACAECHWLKTAAEQQRGRARMFAKLTRPAAAHPGLKGQ